MAEYYRRARDEPAQYTGTVYVARGDGSRVARATEVIQRVREETDPAIEEIPRDVPSSEVYYRRGTRSLERSQGYAYDDDHDYAVAAYAGDPRRLDDNAGRSRKEERRDERRERGRSLSRKEEIAAAAAGAGLALGGKVLLDRRKSSKERSRSRNRLEQVAVGVAGAAAGDLAARRIAKDRDKIRQRKDEAQDFVMGYVGGRRSHDRDRDAYYDDEYDEPPRRQPSRRKSLGELGQVALGALGIGASQTMDRGRGDRGRRHRRRRGSSSSDYSSSDSDYGRVRGGSHDRNDRIQQAAKAALAAAAAEAWRSRKEPGHIYDAQKARRILTAAVGAGGIDALIDSNPNRHEGRHVGEGAIGGLLLNRAVNGPREKSRRQSRSRRSRGSPSRSRSRSRSRSGGSMLKDIAAGGIAAIGTKKALDARNRSRRRRRYSSSSSDRSSGSSSPRRRTRSRSVSSYVDKGMAALGISDRHGDKIDRGMEKLGIKERRGDRSDGGSRGSRRDRARSESLSSIDSNFNLEEEEAKFKKLKGKEYLTAALASVATVHAMHEVVESVGARKKRHAAVESGELSPEKAKQQRRIALAKDAATFGLVGLGIKGTIDNWKEMNNQRTELRDFKRKLKKHREALAMRSRRGSQGPADRFPRSASADPNGRSRRNSVGGPIYRDGNPYAATSGN